LLDSPTNGDEPIDNYQLIRSTGIGMGKYPYPDSDEYSNPPSDNPDIDDFAEFLLGIAEDGQFEYDSRTDIQSAVAEFVQENPDGCFFESSLVDSAVQCDVETLLPTNSVDILSQTSTSDFVHHGSHGAHDLCNLEFTRQLLNQFAGHDLSGFEAKSVIFHTPTMLDKGLCRRIELKLFRKAVLLNWDASTWFRKIANRYTERQKLVSPAYESDKISFQAGFVSQPTPETERIWAGEIITSSPSQMAAPLPEKEEGYRVPEVGELISEHAVHVPPSFNVNRKRISKSVRRECQLQAREALQLIGHLNQEPSVWLNTVRPTFRSPCLVRSAIPRAESPPLFTIEEVLVI